MIKKVYISAILMVFLGFGARAQSILQSRGVDSRVDYGSLTRVGPWDDRNYDLTKEDLEWLAPGEEELRVMVPAFFRVELRRRYPAMRSEGAYQYPRSTLPRFRAAYGGYLVDGMLYRSAERIGEEYVLDLSAPLILGRDWRPEGTLDGEARVAPGAETAVAVNPIDPDLVIAGSNGDFGGQVMYFSSDGGVSWSSAGSLPGGCCDPTLAWSKDGSRAYTVTLGTANDVYLSTDNGQSWNALTVVGSGFVDKEYLHIDRHATSPYLDRLYLTWQLNGVLRFSRSANHGVSWSSPISLSVGQAQDGIGSDITSDRGGNVYYVWTTFEGGMTWVRKSNDGGATFSAAVLVADTVGSYDFPLPAMPNRRVFMYTATDADLSDGTYADSVYVAYTDNTVPDSETPSQNHGRIQVARSRDGGSSWQITTPHETADSDQVDRFHPWLSVGPDGKVYVVFYDTRQDPTRESVDFYFSISDDGAETWTAPARLTSVTSPRPNDSFEWGDYNGLDLAMGRLIGIFTDNRNEGGGGGDSIDVYVVGMSATSSEIFADGFESGDTGSWAMP